jgi:hypothetical protein
VLKTKAEIINYYLSGATMNEVGIFIGKCRMTAQRYLKKHGVKLRKKGEIRKGKPWSLARRAATPPKQQRDPVIVNGKEIKGYELLSYRKRGNKCFSSHGYIRVNTDIRQRQYEHILVAEKALGRKLANSEVVHHIDCDRTNNSPENLLICKIGYHLAMHARMRKHPYWKRPTQAQSA